MLTYTVHEPPNPPADRVDRAEGLVFVKDGFTWTAALLTPFWMLAHRLWWPLVAYVAFSGAFELLERAAGLRGDVTGLVLLAVNLLIGLEADTLRRWALARRGWRTLGTVSGRSLEECERRFFEAWLPAQPVIAPVGPAKPDAPRRWPVIGSLLGARS
jgi:hypothetical protein